MKLPFLTESSGPILAPNQPVSARVRDPARPPPLPLAIRTLREWHSSWRVRRTPQRLGWSAPPGKWSLGREGEPPYWRRSRASTRPEVTRRKKRPRLSRARQIGQSLLPWRATLRTRRNASRARQHPRRRAHPKDRSHHSSGRSRLRGKDLPTGGSRRRPRSHHVREVTLRTLKTCIPSGLISAARPLAHSLAYFDRRSVKYQPVLAMHGPGDTSQSLLHSSPRQ